MEKKKTRNTGKETRQVRTKRPGGWSRTRSSSSHTDNGGQCGIWIRIRSGSAPPRTSGPAAGTLHIAHLLFSRQKAVSLGQQSRQEVRRDEDQGVEPEAEADEPQLYRCGAVVQVEDAASRERLVPARRGSHSLSHREGLPLSDPSTHQSERCRK